MIYYGLAAIFPLFCWAFHDWWDKKNALSTKKKKSLKIGMVVVAILPMFLLFVLRSKDIGSDTIVYVRFFQKDIRFYSWAKIFNKDTMRFELGFRIYTKLISLLTNSYTVYFLINALVIFGILFRFSFKYTENPFVFFFLFITLGTYAFFETGLRQALAMVICLLAVDGIKERRPIRFLLFVILAYYFHKSALIFLIVYPLSIIKKYDWAIFIYLILSIVFVVGFTLFQNLFNQILDYEYDVEETGNGWIFLSLVFVLFAYSCFMTYRKQDDEKTETVIFHLALLSVLFWVLRLISRTAERISFYFMFGLYIYFSQVFKLERDKLASLTKWILLLVCMVLFVYRNIEVEYLFFWQ